MNKPKVHCYYRHFKGDLYFVESIGTHTETGEKLVTYVRAEDRFDPEVERWHRPLHEHAKAFTTPVEIPIGDTARTVNRFEKVGDEAAS